jgi:hypothetical protein
VKFLCIGYFSESAMSALAPGAVDALMAKCGPHLKELYGTGQVRLDAGLGVAAKLMRREGGRVRVTDGPFTEAKEVIGSAILIEAADMDDAVRVAALHPTTRLPEGEDLGWRLEIRPVEYLGPPSSGPQ